MNKNKPENRYCYRQHLTDDEDWSIRFILQGTNKLGSFKKLYFSA